jgi:hypothetical protein
MTQAAKKVNQRDGRLSLALLLFVIFAGSMLVQTWILLLYFRSAIESNWAKFLELFPSYDFQPRGPGVACYDSCYPDLPFVAGWIGLICFFLGLSLLVNSWWTSKSRGSLQGSQGSPEGQQER